MCQLHPSPSPASTALGLAPVYAYELMDLRWGFMLLPSWKWEAHDDKNFNLLYLTFHGEPAVLSALPGRSCLPHRSGGMVPGHDPAIGTVPRQPFPVAAGHRPPHPVFPWDTVSLETPAPHPSTFRWLLPLLAVPEPCCSIQSSSPSLPRSFIAPAWPLPSPSSPNQPSRAPPRP